MFTDVLNILKFVTDPQTRQTIQSIAVVASRYDKDWAKSIKKMSGKFSGADMARVNAFANSLFAELEGTGLSQEKILKCQTVFSELMNNAFQHGCQFRQNCFVHVDCIYSRWFVEIEVRDDGKGFNLTQVLENPVEDRGRRTGLKLVYDLTDKLSANSKGNIVTALIASADRITVATTTETYGRAEMSVIVLGEQDEWSFLNASWGPLQRELNRAKQKYILVTWKSGIRRNPWNTGKLGRFVEQVVTGCQLDNKRYHSFVMNEDWVFQDLQAQNAENIRFFDNEREARAWIIGVITALAPEALTSEHVCPDCQRSNRVEAKWCSYCGNPLIVRRCSQCGFENRVQARFCTTCGYLLLTVQTSGI